MTEKKLADYKFTQMPLFEAPFMPDNFSNTIELYDSIPKYVWGKLPRWAKENSQEKLFLDPIERSFKFKGKHYTVVITPASIKGQNGAFTDYFPKEREEIIEDALRKLVYDGAECFLEDLAGVVFTMYQLIQELKRMGHTHSLDVIKEALKICA